MSAASMLLVAGGVWLALREARLADPARGHTRFAALLALGGFYLFLVFGWGGWTG